MQVMRVPYVVHSPYAPPLIAHYAIESAFLFMGCYQGKFRKSRELFNVNEAAIGSLTCHNWHALPGACDAGGQGRLSERSPP
jgi:hypothetical protein